MSGIFNYLLQPDHFGGLAFDRFPGRAQFGGFDFKRRQFVSNRPKPFVFQPLGASLLLVTLQRCLFYFELHNLPVSRVKFGWLAVGLNAQMTGRFIHHVNGFIRQKPLIDIAMRQLRRCHQRLIGDAHPMMDFIFFFQSTQNENAFLDRWFIDKDRLKPPRQRRVFFDICAIFINRCRANTAQFAARQSRLQQI